MPATIFFDNTAIANNTGTKVGVFGTNPYDSFSIPNSSPLWTLNLVKVVLVAQFGPGPFTFIFDLNLYADSGANTPGAKLATLVSGASFVVAFGAPVLVTPAITPVSNLAPGRYWIDMEDPTSSGVSWQDPNNNVGAQGTGVAGEFNGEFLNPPFTALNNNVSSPALQMLVAGDPVAPTGPNPRIDPTKIRMIVLPTACVERKLCLPMASSKEFINRA